MPGTADNQPAAGASSKAYADGSCVNTYGARLPGERAFITGRPTSRVNAPPGGRATVDLGGGYGEGGRAADVKRAPSPLQAVAGLAAGVRVARDAPESRPQLPGARNVPTTTQAAAAAAAAPRAAAPPRNTTHLVSSIVLG